LVRNSLHKSIYPCAVSIKSSIRYSNSPFLLRSFIFNDFLKTLHVVINDHGGLWTTHQVFVFVQ